MANDLPELKDLMQDSFISMAKLSELETPREAVIANQISVDEQEVLNEKMTREYEQSKRPHDTRSSPQDVQNDAV